MKILIKIINLNKVIFQLCFNIKIYFKCHITILDKNDFIKKILNKKNLSIDNFNYFDSLNSKIDNFNNFNLILQDNEYNYKDLFKKINVIRNYHISVHKDKINYQYSDEKDYNKYIDSKLNFELTDFQKIDINNIERLKLKEKSNVNFIFYGFKRCKEKINFKSKFKNKIKSPIDKLRIFYSYPNYLDELKFDSSVDNSFFHKSGFNDIYIKKNNYNNKIITYIKELKSNDFVKNYLINLKVYDRVRFIRIYSMINSIIDSLELLKQNINDIDDNDIFILTRYDTFSINPRIRFIYDLNYYKNSMFILRNKFHPSIEDRLLIMNKKQILELSNYLIYIKNNLQIAIENNLITAKECVFSPEFTIRNFFAKHYFLYYYHNFDLSRFKPNSSKNSEKIFLYYEKLFYEN